MKKISLKKLLVCIMFSVMVTSFIGFTICFLENVSMNSWITAWNELDSNEEFINDTKSHANEISGIYDQFQEGVSNLKEKYGDDYPAEAVLLEKCMMVSNSEEEINVYLFSVIIGICLGSVVYILNEQKASGKVLVIELLVSAGIILILLFGIDLVYDLIINNLIKSAGYDFVFKYYGAFDGDVKAFILGAFVVLIVIVYLANLVVQKISSKKLNEELNKKIEKTE